VTLASTARSWASVNPFEAAGTAGQQDRAGLGLDAALLAARLASPVSMPAMNRNSFALTRVRWVYWPHGSAEVGGIVDVDVRGHAGSFRPPKGMRAQLRGA
jgi:hypothetical protein